jgi:hypothetical protein
VAQLGDWVVGTGPKTRGREKHIVYAMRVTSAMTFEQYWMELRFQNKKPNLRGSKKQAFGDNIYHRSGNSKVWCQLNSHHSLHDGTANPSNVIADTATNRILISDDFVYWGGVGPKLPSKFLKFGPQQFNICAGRNHKNNFSDEFVRELIDWVRELGETGYIGEPSDWKRTP